ncbi:MAG: tRNA (adenosine(37)-N6)-threonylcarbamoyltransferase complex dimerization subunit type 1 TsaB [Calditrichaeota bacterium]|nr:tRNA (adenosine(37)-N6)-threonylcarbamoyltransferase complex dimerization subunit type 1 TsaB [Calditrichota bacterium]
MSAPENPLIFALDTSSVFTIFGLVYADKLIAEACFRAPLEMRDRLPLQIDAFLREHEAKHGRMGAIAIAIGPGSFTGLRVGLSSAKGMAFARAIPIWPVSSLKVLAANARGLGRKIAAIIPARKGECYLGLYDSEELYELREPACFSHAELMQHVPEDGILLGPAVEELSAEYREKFAAQLERARPKYHQPSALYLAQLAMKEWEGKEAPDLDSLAPFYLKEFPASPTEDGGGW